jgi:hypothetical protein
MAEIWAAGAKFSMSFIVPFVILEIGLGPEKQIKG